MSKPHWRRAHTPDLPAIGSIAARIHPNLAERLDVLAEKVLLYPDGCRVLAAENEIFGYGLSHPWMQHQIPPLDAFLERLPDKSDCLYVHDVAVLPEFRNGGAARAYVATIERLARSSGFATLALVSVYATRPLWENFGFHAVRPDAELRAKLDCYGESATYMLRDLADSQRPVR